jgi:preprotein translocase subunit SecD/SecD/SecF fusion protein
MDPKQQNILLLGLTAVLVTGSWLLFWPPGEKITQGLDIQGGLSVILTAESTTTVTASEMERAVTIVQNRVDSLGVREASVQQQGNDSILVQVPGIDDPEKALEVLGSTGQLEFVQVSTIDDTATIAALQTGEDGVQLQDGTYEPFMTGEVVTNATVSQDPTTGEVVVNVEMDAEGTSIWGAKTTELFPAGVQGQPEGQIAIVLDGVVQSAPYVQSAITDGRTQITGNFTADSARQLRTVLQTGALPVSLAFSESRIVGPTLGQESLQQGVYAGLLGLLIVALYLLAFYRGLGLLTFGALVTFASFFLGILALLSRMDLFALTLPGIAGVVLTIGLAADSSILILERFKEEVRMGKTIRSAANSGSRHGIMTSVDADLVSLVSAAVLYLVAIGPVRGFALTLMIGLLCDMVMMLIFKRPALMLLAESIIPKSPRFWGVPREMVANKVGRSAKGGVADA